MGLYPVMNAHHLQTGSNSGFESPARRIQRFAFRLFFLSALGSNLAVAQVGVPNVGWWGVTDWDARILYDQVLKAGKGDRAAQITSAFLFAKGQGAPEGPNLDAADYWIQRAIAAGDKTSFGISAVISILRNPADTERVGELMELAVASSPAKKPTFGAGQQLSPECAASKYCSNYSMLLGMYCRTFVKYPISARKAGTEGEVLAEFNTGTATVRIVSKDAMPEFAEAVRTVITEALNRIPVPLDYAGKGKNIQVPISFKLSP